METILLLLSIAALVAFFIWMKRDKEAKQTKPTIEKDTTALSLDNINVGGTVQISTMEEPYFDYQLVITKKNIYREDQYEWFEFVGDNGKEEVTVEYESGDGRHIGLQVEQLKLKDLAINESDLERFDDQEEGSFTHKNLIFHYKDSGEAMFYRNGDESRPEKIYYWDFGASDGKNLLGCVKRRDGSITITHSVALKESDVQVLSLT